MMTCQCGKTIAVQVYTYRETTDENGNIITVEGYEGVGDAPYAIALYRHWMECTAYPQPENLLTDYENSMNSLIAQLEDEKNTKLYQKRQELGLTNE